MARFRQARDSADTTSKAVFSRFSTRSKRVLITTVELGRPFRHYGSGALLAALADEVDGPAGRALFECGVGFEAALIVTAALEPPRADLSTQLPPSPVVRRIVLNAGLYQEKSGLPEVTTGHILRAVLDESDSVSAAILDALSISPDVVRSRLRQLTEIDKVGDNSLSRGSDEVIEERIELSHPASLVWALIEPPDNAHLLDPKVVSGERRTDELGREVHVQRTTHPVPHDLIEYLVHTEVPGRRASVLQILPPSPTATPTTFEVIPDRSQSTLQIGTHLDLGGVRRSQLGTAQLATRSQLRQSLETVARVLDGGWTPAATSHTATGEGDAD